VEDDGIGSRHREANRRDIVPVESTEMGDMRYYFGQQLWDAL
jgi:hypothetical protein